MNTNLVTIIAITVLAIVILVGVFWTKKPGFGRYAASLLILTLVISVAAIFVINEKLDGQYLANILFAAAGFSGGLITGKTDGA